MGYLYSAPMEALAFTTATDVFEFSVGAGRPVILHMMELSGSAPDVGDAQEEILHIGLYRAATAGATGTALTEAAYTDTENPAVETAVVANRGTASTGGTLIQVLGWNVRIPTQWIWTPEMRPEFAISTVGTFRLKEAPADSITLSGTLVWEEL